MGAFLAIVIGVLSGVVFFMVYISVRTAAFPVVVKLTGSRKLLAVLACFAVWTGLFYLLSLLIGPVNTLICIVHLGGFWLLSELVFYLLKKAAHRNIRNYLSGVCAILFTLCYMLAAWYLCTHVWEKDYSLDSDFLKGDLRIVQFADSHVGATFHAQKLHEYMHEINALHPDLVVVTGDFVDDDTTREDMIGSCEALGTLETAYGVYFCYGNHDKGYYSDEAKGWSNDDLLENLAKNGVIVLQDEARLIDDRFYVIGRQDKSEEGRGTGRAAVSQLMDGLDSDLYRIVLDHQPCEYAQEEAAGANLVLSGHTHGGQFFPFNNIGVLTRQYDRSYGHERRGNTDFIVTSGISDWNLIFKTGCRSEYVVIDVHGKQ